MTEAHVKNAKADGKAYCPDIRMMVYAAIVNQVPTVNITPMIQQGARRFDITLTDVPHRSTVEFMTRELGSISDLKAAEAIMSNQNTTLGDPCYYSIGSTCQQHSCDNRELLQCC